MVSTDVSCDRCDEWTEGVVGPSVDRAGARAAAKRAGWTHHRGRDLCPSCTTAIEIEEATDD
jgi:hypothetical protein